MTLNKFIILCLIISFLPMFSCHENMEENVAGMLGEKVNFDPADFQIVKGRKNICPSEARYRLIIYLDSLECLSCASGRLNQWNKMIVANFNRNIRFDFIFAPRVKQWKMIRNSVEFSRFIRDVYIDTAGVFKKMHPWLPKSQQCHTFLVDNNDSVVMVGDPRRNKKLMGLFKSIIDI